MPTEAISSHPIKYDHNDCWGITYTITGVTIPLFTEATHQHLIKKVKIII